MNAICVFITIMPCKKKIEDIDNQRLEFIFHEKQIFVFSLNAGKQGPENFQYRHVLRSVNLEQPNLKRKS